MDLYLLCMFLLTSPAWSAGDVPVCEDLNTAACSLFLASKPDMCQDQALSANCQRFCGFCPLICYDCPTAVNNSQDCSTTTACQTDEVCIQRKHSYPDGTNEYIMGCEKKTTCDGLNLGFHSLIGKREIEDDGRLRRDINFHCCDTDMCNLPMAFTTSTLPPTTTTMPTTPHTTLKPLHNCSRDIVFILDGSSSIGAHNHYYMLQFAHYLISSLRIGAMDSLVAVVEYSDTARVEWYLTDHMSLGELQTAIESIPYVTGSTATHAAFWLTRNSVLTQRHGARPNAADVIVYITDGGTDLPGMAISEAKQLHDQGVEIITIGVGSNVDTYEVSQISSTYSYTTSSFPALTNIIGSVQQDLCR